MTKVFRDNKAKIGITVSSVIAVATTYLAYRTVVPFWSLVFSSLVSMTYVTENIPF